MRNYNITIKDILLSAHQRMGDKSIEGLNLSINGTAEEKDNFSWSVVDGFRGPMFYSIMWMTHSNPQIFRQKMSVKIAEDNYLCNKDSFLEYLQQKDVSELIGCFNSVKEWGAEIINEMY